MVAPNGFWMKTHVYREGNWLKAKSYLVMAGDPIVFEVGIDLNRVRNAVLRYHQRLHQQLSEAKEISGCIGCDSDATISGLMGNLSKAVSKVGKSKLIAKVSATTKKVVNSKVGQTLKKADQLGRKVLKSKVTAGIVSAAAVIYPPVGVPAAAAYATANAVLAAVERAEKAKKTAQKIVATAKATGKKIVLAKDTKTKLASAVKLATTAKTQVAKLQLAAKTSSDPTKKAEAQKMMKVLAVVAKNRENIKKIPITTPVQQAGKIAAANQKTALANQKTIAAQQATAMATQVVEMAQADPTPENQEAAKEAAAVALEAKAEATAGKVEALNAQAEVVAPLSRSQGLIVTESGLIVRGAFNELPIGSGGLVAKMYHPGKSFTGEFQQISGAMQVVSQLDEIGFSLRPKAVFQRAKQVAKAAYDPRQLAKQAKAVAKKTMDPRQIYKQTKFIAKKTMDPRQLVAQTKMLAKPKQLVSQAKQAFNVLSPVQTAQVTNMAAQLSGLSPAQKSQLAKVIKQKGIRIAGCIGCM